MALWQWVWPSSRSRGGIRRNSVCIVCCRLCLLSPRPVASDQSSRAPSPAPRLVLHAPATESVERRIGDAHGPSDARRHWLAGYPCPRSAAGALRTRTNCDQEQLEKRRCSIRAWSKATRPAGQKYGQHISAGDRGRRGQPTDRQQEAVLDRSSSESGGRCRPP